MKFENILALDVGRAATGCAFASREILIALPLDSIKHTSDTALCDRVAAIAQERDIGTLVLGLPLHTSGTEGEEAEHVRIIGDALSVILPDCAIAYVDERFTSSQARRSGAADEHAASAVFLLQMHLARQEKR